MAKSINGVVETGSIEGVTGIKCTRDVIITEAVARNMETTLIICAGVLGTELSVITVECSWGIGAAK